MLRILILVVALVAGGATAQDLRVAVAAMGGSLDAGAMWSNNQLFAIDAIYDPLIARDPHTTEPIYEPALATAWRFVEPTVLELELREGVRFHNGDVLTAEDVKFSLERFRDPAFPSPSGFSLAFNVIERVEVVDELTVRVVTAAPDPALLGILSIPQASIVPMQHVLEVGYEAFGLAPVGTGPYAVTAFTPGEEIRLARFDAFWDEPAPVASIHVRTVPEVATRVTALVNREFDIVTNLPPDQVATIRSTPCCEIREILVPNVHTLHFNSPLGPMQDQKLRQAMALAIDRQLLVDGLWNGAAEVPNGHQFPQYGTAYHADREPITLRYDPERARDLLEESSYAGEPIVFHTLSAYYTNGYLAAQAIVEMWRAIGIDAQLVVDPDSYWDYEAAHVFSHSNGMTFPDPHGGFSAYAPGGARGPDIWVGEHQEYEALYMDEFRYEADPEARAEAYGRVMDYYENFVPGTVLYQPVEYYGVAVGVEWEPLPGTPAYVMKFRAGNLELDR